MLPEQIKTDMVNEATSHKILISTIYLPHDPYLHPHPEAMWETMVFEYSKNGVKTLAFFPEDCPLESGYSFFYDKQIRGGDRNLQHEYTLNLAQKRGYRIVTQRDNLEEWNKRLEGLSSLDFTLEELRRLEFYKWLRNQGRI